MLDISRSNFVGKFVLIVFAGHEIYHMHLQNVHKKIAGNGATCQNLHIRRQNYLAEKIDLKVVCHLKFNLGLHNKMMAAIKLSEDPSRS